jgi:hypothetical protein
MAMELASCAIAMDIKVEMMAPMYVKYASTINHNTGIKIFSMFTSVSVHGMCM